MTDCCEIDVIKFGILSPEEIKSMAVCRVDKPGLSGPGTIYDKAMGFMPGTNESCTTCGQKKDCWGHFGYIQLNEPVLHPMFQKLTVSFLKCFCKSCHRLLITEDQIELADLSNLKKERRFHKILEKLEKIDICSHCGSLQPKILFKSKENTIVMEHKKKNEDGSKTNLIMSVEDIRNIFENVLSQDIVSLGLNPKNVHPRNLILTVLPVIPPCSRPFITADGNICDDDLTYQYIEIIKSNNMLSDSEENTKKPATEQIRQKVINLCKFRITTLMNNSKGQAKHPTDSRALKCIKSRLGGKQGRLRGNLMG